MSFPVDVIFAHPDAGLEGDQEHARRCGLVPGHVYGLRSVQVGQSDTLLELNGFKDERFSSCLFEPWTDPDEDDAGDPGPYLVLSELTLAAVQAEATRAYLKHQGSSMLGTSFGNSARFAIAAEEITEASDEALSWALDLLAASGMMSRAMGAIARELNEADLAHRDAGDHRTRLVTELIQSAAMFLTWVEALEGTRRQNPGNARVLTRYTTGHAEVEVTARQRGSLAETSDFPGGAQ